MRHVISLMLSNLSHSVLVLGLTLPLAAPSCSGAELGGLVSTTPSSTAAMPETPAPILAAEPLADASPAPRLRRPGCSDEPPPLPDPEAGVCLPAS